MRKTTAKKLRKASVSREDYRARKKFYLRLDRASRAAFITPFP